MSLSNLRTDEEELERLSGLFVGQLDEQEMDLFCRMVKEGKAARSYSGIAGLLGLARVVIAEREAS